MDTNTVSDDCSGPGSTGPGTGIEGSGRTDFGSIGFSGGFATIPAQVPEPASLTLLGAGIASQRGPSASDGMTTLAVLLIQSVLR